jgi:hypothetical protein
MGLRQRCILGVWPWYTFLSVGIFHCVFESSLLFSLSLILYLSSFPFYFFLCSKVVYDDEIVFAEPFGSFTYGEGDPVLPSPNHCGILSFFFLLC